MQHQQQMMSQQQQQQLRLKRSASEELEESIPAKNMALFDSPVGRNDQFPQMMATPQQNNMGQQMMMNYQMNPQQMAFNFIQQQQQQHQQQQPTQNHMQQQWMQNGRPMNQMMMMTPGFCPQDFVNSPPGSQNSSLLQTPDSGVGSSSSCSPNMSQASSRKDTEPWSVQGRLCQVGNLRDYQVTKEEILRRISAPECMNSSSLAAMLRKAKTKNSGTEMRQQFNDMGIDIPTNKRKGRKPTAFSALVENESINAARDLDTIVNSQHAGLPDYPTEELAGCMSVAASPMHREQRKIMMANVVQFMSEMLTLYDQISVPLPGAVPPPNPAVLGPYNEGMKNASALTHGFVIPNQKTWAVQFQRIAKHAFNILNSQQQPQFGNIRPM